MIQKVRGIVLHHLNYGDTSIIVHFYTDLFGRVSVMIKGARGQRKNRKISLYHPLALLEIEINFKENRDLQQIREARPILPLQGIMADPIKNTIALFIAEILYRSIREKESNKDLFEYLQTSIELFDLLEDGSSMFHLYMLVHLTRFLGFRPALPPDDQAYWFNLETGSFTLGRPSQEKRMQPELASHLINLIKAKPDELGSLKIPRNQKNELIESLLEYYKIHLAGMGEIKSYSILKAVFE